MNSEITHDIRAIDINLLLKLRELPRRTRRLHDTGKSGWLQLLVLIPCAGAIILYVLWAQAGSEADNQYGSPPA